MSDSARKTPGQVIFLVGMVTAIAYLVMLPQPNGMLKIAIKPIPVLAMMVWIQFHAKDRYARFLQIGLFLSAIGDVVLMFKGGGAFIGGLASFLVAHLMYIVAFSTRERRLFPVRFLPFLLWVSLLVAWLWGGLKGMKLPVSLYALTIAAMMWRSSCLLETPSMSKNPARWALLGAIAFAVSDSLLATNKFGPRIPHIGYAIMTFYWLGQWGLTLSVLNNSSASTEGASS